MENKTNECEVVKFNVGNMFLQLTLGGNDFVLITKNNPHFVNYVKFNNNFGFNDNDSYTVTHGRLKKRISQNAEFCKSFNLNARHAMTENDIKKFNFIPMTNHEVSRLSTDELNVMNKIGLNIVTID
jgi:hypothetical protein